MKFLSILLLLITPTFSKETSLSDKVSLLSGYGGNILKIETKEGIVLIDSGDPEDVQNLTKVVPDAKYIVLTHRHGDHVGGSAFYGEKGAKIIAHKNTDKYIKNSKMKPIGYPSTVVEGDYTLRVGGETIELIYYPNAHTDGDIVAFLPKENIIILGDISFGPRYNYLDVAHGGTIDGLINATEKIIKLINKNTIVIPGHGNLMDRKQLQDNLAMFKDIKGKIQTLKNKGLSLSEVIEAAPSKKYDKQGAWFMLPADKFVESIYNTLP